jgi:hypothetical protein
MVLLHEGGEIDENPVRGQVPIGKSSRLMGHRSASFTAKKFRQFCRAHQIDHVEVAVATPRANGQVERLNHSVLSALATTSKSEDTWDTVVNNVQFAINNTVNKTTNRTPSELLMGYKPNPSELFKAIPDLNDVIRDLEALRKETQMRIAAEQEHQKTKTTPSISGERPSVGGDKSDR